MPQVTVYIRQEDLDKWKAIEKKSEWVHTHLKFKVGIDTVDTDLGKIDYPVVSKIEPSENIKANKDGKKIK